MPDDKERILNIRRNLYDGLDFMPEFFPKLVSPINGTGFLVTHKDETVSSKPLKRQSRLQQTSNIATSFPIFDKNKV